MTKIEMVRCLNLVPHTDKTVTDVEPWMLPEFDLQVAYEFASKC